MFAKQQQKAKFQSLPSTPQMSQAPAQNQAAPKPMSAPQQSSAPSFQLPPTMAQGQKPMGQGYKAAPVPGPQSDPNSPMGKLQDAAANGANYNGETNNYHPNWGQTPSPETPAETPIDYQQRFDDEWSGIQDQHNAGLGGMLEGTYADEANAARRSSEMNAAMGGGVGGAFAGGQAQVALGGMQQRLGARNEHLKQGLEMKMSVLQRYLQQAEQEKDRDLQRWLQTEADKTAMELAEMGYESEESQNQAMADSVNSAESNPGGWSPDFTYEGSTTQDFIDKINPF